MLFKISGKIVDDQYTGDEMEDFYPDNTFYLHVEVENQVKCHVQLPAEDVGDEVTYLKVMNLEVMKMICIMTIFWQAATRRKMCLWIV